MKKQEIKENKGITLLALVITIIVLLILAMVSISLVMNTGIINHANNAVINYKEAEENEQKQLNVIEDEMEKYTENAEWWKLTEKEEKEIEDIGNGEYFVAWNGITIQNGGKYVEIIPNQIIAILISPNEHYMFFMTEEQAEGMLGAETNYDLYKWYKLTVDDSFNIELVEEYTGTSPIQKSDFIKIYSESYLERVINSFNK